MAKEHELYVQVTGDESDREGVDSGDGYIHSSKDTPVSMRDSFMKAALSTPKPLSRVAERDGPDAFSAPVSPVARTKTVAPVLDEDIDHFMRSNFTYVEDVSSFKAGNGDEEENVDRAEVAASNSALSSKFSRKGSGFASFKAATFRIVRPAVLCSPARTRRTTRWGSSRSPA
jgi:hypothetical protein